MIEKITENTKNAIKQKSVYNLPDRPSEMGMNPTEIKKAFYQPIIDLNSSVLTEIDRVIDEANLDINTIKNNLDQTVTTVNDTLETVNELSVKNQEILNKSETLTENTNNLLSDYQTTLNNIYTDIDDLKNEVEGLDENYQILQELHDREKNIELEITNDKWNETSDYLPFKYKCLLNVTSQDLTKIELLNNLPIIFANYGISLYYNESETTFYLLAINKPLDTINLSFIADCTTISITT